MQKKQVRTRKFRPNWIRINGAALILGTMIAAPVYLMSTDAEEIEVQQPKTEVKNVETDYMCYVVNEVETKRIKLQGLDSKYIAVYDINMFIDLDLKAGDSVTVSFVKNSDGSRSVTKATKQAGNVVNYKGETVEVDYTTK